MNCKQAREIMNLVFDGERPANEPSAQWHVHECAECGEWLAGTERVMGMVASACASVPQVDVAQGVMARLPDCHPASTRSRRQLAYGRVLAWMGGIWVIGLAFLMGLGMLLGRLLTGTWGIQEVSAAYDAGRAVISSVGALFSHVMSPVGGMADGILSYRMQALNGAIVFMIADFAVLILAYAIWRRKPGAQRTMFLVV